MPHPQSGPLDVPLPRVAVVVPVFNKLALTRRFLASFRQVDYPARTLVVVDDGSTDGTAETLAREHPEVVRLEGNGRLWWAGGTNQGVRYALETGHDYVLTINNDTVVRPDFLRRLVATARVQPRRIVGARINCLDRPETIWSIGAYSGWQTGLFLQCSHHGGQERVVLPCLRNPVPVEVLTGCGTLVPADCYREIGLYDDRWCPQYHADSDFVMRARRHGYEAVVDLDAVIWNDVHNTSTNRNFLSRRSPWFWRPVLAVHLRHCPREWLFHSFVHFYLSSYFPNLHRRLSRWKQRVRGWLPRRKPACQQAGTIP